jgi:hypothetical protein
VILRTPSSIVRRYSGQKVDRGKSLLAWIQGEYLNAGLSFAPVALDGGSSIAIDDRGSARLRAIDGPIRYEIRDHDHKEICGTAPILPFYAAASENSRSGASMWGVRASPVGAATSVSISESPSSDSFRWRYSLAPRAYAPIVRGISHRSASVLGN